MTRLSLSRLIVLCILFLFSRQYIDDPDADYLQRAWSAWEFLYYARRNIAAPEAKAREEAMRRVWDDE